jgi:hypothetical protein
VKSLASAVQWRLQLVAVPVVLITILIDTMRMASSEDYFALMRTALVSEGGFSFFITGVSFVIMATTLAHNLDNDDLVVTIRGDGITQAICFLGLFFFLALLMKLPTAHADNEPVNGYDWFRLAIGTASLELGLLYSSYLKIERRSEHARASAATLSTTPDQRWTSWPNNLKTMPEPQA